VSTFSKCSRLIGVVFVVAGLIVFVVTIRMISGDATHVQKDFDLYMNGPGGLMTTTGRQHILCLCSGAGKLTSVYSNVVSGNATGLFVFGYMLYTVIVVAMQYKVMLMTHTRTWINWTLWILSFIGYFLFTYVYGAFDSIDWYTIRA
jgi:hypothetical protein